MRSSRGLPLLGRSRRARSGNYYSSRCHNKLAGSGEALDIFRERTDTLLRAGVGLTEQTTERGFDFALIDVHPVSLAENGAQHFRRRMLPTGVLRPICPRRFLWFTP